MEIIPDEGLDYILAIFPKNGANLATSYVGLFTGLTQTTVPAASAVLATYGGAAFGEAAPGGYARQSVAAASWGATGAKTIWSQSCRGATAGQVSFPAVTGSTYSTQINGFFLTNLLAHGSEIGLFYSNFDDSTGIPSLNVGDVVKVTPTFGLLN